MAEEQEFTQLCKLPAQPSHPHCVNNTYRSAQHSQALLRGLLALRDSGILFDVVLVVEGRHIEAHRILLAASCDYFRGMFAGGLKEMEQEEVLIHGVSYNAMCQILHFIYTSELELSLSNVQETLVAACQLQIPEIIHFCCDFLMSWVDEENILDVYRLAELFDLSRLTEQLDTYILKNFVAFSRTDKYRQLPLEKVYSLLSSNRLEVSCETEVYEGALLYHYSLEQVQADQISLHEPPKLLETVRFPLMEAEVLQRLHDKLDPSPLRDTVASALMYHRNESLQPSLQSPQTELRSDFQCVVGFGGIHSTPSTVLSDQAKYLNPLLGEWKHFTASLAPRMSNQGIAVLNNFVYLIGGDNNVQGFRAESRCWRYDPRHNRWFQIQSLQQEHADLSVCVVGRYIYAVAGRDYHNDLNAVERYDPATNCWAYVAPLKREVYAHAGATLEGKMYITCGRRGEDYLKETHCYDPGSNTWHTLADGPVRRAWHGMATLLNKLYVIGGSNNDAGYRRDVHQVACYSCTSGQWSSVCPLPAGHGEPGIAVLDNRIYVLGGRSHNRGSRMGYVHIYDVEKDCWEEGPQLDNSISGLAACVLTLPRSLLLEPPRGTPDRSQADPDFASELPGAHVLRWLEAARGRVWDCGVRRQLHVLGERGVREAWRVPLPPRLLRCQLRHQCGQCKGQQPCTVAEGRCLTCEPGWNGTKCDQPCATGFYGEGCSHRCPPCRDGHACNHVTGKCTRCNAGWIGDRCETKCSNGTYGEDCAFVCADCGSGHCDFQSGRCLCSPGVHGPHCNVTCPPGLHGADCAQACSCHEDSCDPVTGACHLETNQRKGVMGAGALLVLLVCLLLSLLGCCCACRGKDPARRELSLGRKKAPHRLCGRFSRISMKLPRIPLRRQKLPKVVEAPEESRDPEVPTVPVEAPAPSPVPLTTPASAEEAMPLPASSDSERSASSVEGPGGALYARVARREARPARARGEIGGLSLSPSPERRKPPPPDPATKPKVSWIHGRHSAAAAGRAPSPPPPGPEAAPSPSKRKRTPSDKSAQPVDHGSPRTRDPTPRPPGLPEEAMALAAPSPPRARARGRGPSLLEPTDAGGPPRSAPEAASMLAAELRGKTRSLGRAEGALGAQGPREKPAPPQKAKRSVPPASPARAPPATETPGPEKAATDVPAPETPRKKTPIQKPPRKKSREAAGELGRAGAPTL
uniref:Kelch-like protein 22 n=1 Tax=Piliocolobus tephrosceles TaxID=591936 RepID=A0A8C9IZ60_9PRIM